MRKFRSPTCDSSDDDSSSAPKNSSGAVKPKNAVLMLHQSAAGLAEILVFKEASTVETLR